VRDLIVEPDLSMSRTGGILRVDARSQGEVVLRSVRFTCEGCRRRVRAALEGSRGVVSVEDAGTDELAVGYTPAWLSTTGVAEAARRALESDPSNPAPVAVIYDTGPD
jgi:hypothetical protein